MDIEKEDIVFPFLFLLVFAFGLAFLLKYDSNLPGLLILWIGVTLLIIGYSYIYKRKNRDMNILKIRFLFVIPAYPVALYYFYLTNIIGYDLSKNESLLLNGFVLVWIILGTIVEYIYRRKKSKKI